MNKQIKQLKKPSDYPIMCIRPRDDGQKARLRAFRKHYSSWQIMADIWEKALKADLNK